MRSASASAAAIWLALSVLSWGAWVAASPVPSPVTPEDTSEVDNFDSRVSLTLEEMSALHSSTHRPHAPPVVKRSLTVESDPPPADNSDAVLRRAPTLLQLEAGVRGGVPSLPEDNLVAALPPPQPPQHRDSRRRRQALDAPALTPEESGESLDVVPLPVLSGFPSDDASYSFLE